MLKTHQGVLSIKTHQAVSGTVYRSPVSRLPPSGGKPVITSTCSGEKTPRAIKPGANKENLELNGSILSGMFS